MHVFQDKFKNLNLYLNYPESCSIPVNKSFCWFGFFFLLTLSRILSPPPYKSPEDSISLTVRTKVFKQQPDTEHISTYLCPVAPGSPSSSSNTECSPDTLKAFALTVPSPWNALPHPLSLLRLQANVTILEKTSLITFQKMWPLLPSSPCSPFLLYFILSHLPLCILIMHVCCLSSAPTRMTLCEDKGLDLF